MGDRVRKLLDEMRVSGECGDDINELRKIRHEVLTTWDIDSVRAITAKIKEIREDNPDGRGIEAVRLAYRTVRTKSERVRKAQQEVMESITALDDLREMRHEVMTEWSAAATRAFLTKYREIRADNPDGKAIDDFRLAHRLTKASQKVDGDGKDA